MRIKDDRMIEVAFKNNDSEVWYIQQFNHKHNDHIFLGDGDNGDYAGMTLDVFQNEGYPYK